MNHLPVAEKDIRENRVFAAGGWGIVVLTPLYFVFDPVGRQPTSLSPGAPRRI